MILGEDPKHVIDTFDYWSILDLMLDLNSLTFIDFISCSLFSSVLGWLAGLGCPTRMLAVFHATAGGLTALQSNRDF